MTDEKSDTDSDANTGTAATSPAERWTKASEGVQTTAKWIITALAAVGAVMFAKGFVTAPALSFTADRRQLVYAWLLGVAGVLGVALLIWATSRVLFPTVVTLRSLPPKFEQLIEQDAADFLPSGSSSIAEFQARLLEHRQSADFAQMEIRKRGRDLSRNESAENDALAECEQLRARLDDLEQQGATADKIAEARRHVEAAEEGHREARRNRQAIEREIEAMEHQAAVIVANRDLYLAKRQEILDRAQFWSASNNYRAGPGKAMIFGAVLAAAGGIGYQLALATPADEDDASSGSSSSGPVFPRTASLVQSQTQAGEDLWAAASLTECEVVSAPPTVGVVLLDGAGTLEDPWSVSTIPTESCKLRTFSVVNDVALVVEEPSLPIEFTPAPEESTSEPSTR